MGDSRTVLDAYEEALGLTPAQIISRGSSLGPSDLAAVLEARRQPEPTTGVTPPVATEVWPLVSHHTYEDRAIFGTNRHILPRVLTLIMLHDGIVAADPMETVYRILTTRSEDEAIHTFNRATEELARVEALIAAGVLRLTARRPDLQGSNRTAVLGAFGVDSDLRVFTDFLEAAASLDAFPGSFARTYAPQVRDLYGVFGLHIRQPRTLMEAERRVRDLAAALIEVSWQFAVAAEDPVCDIALRGGLEWHLAEAVVSEGFNKALGPGRHLSTLDLGLVPNLDPSQLTVPDAIAIRHENGFESFRHTVRTALDHLEVAERSGVPQSRAHAAFEEAMQEEARSLRESAKRAGFRDLLRGASVPAALGVVNGLVLSPLGPFASAGGGGAASLAGVVWLWFLGRRSDQRQAVCQRYLSLLGSPRDAA